MGSVALFFLSYVLQTVVICQLIPTQNTGPTGSAPTTDSGDASSKTLGATIILPTSGISDTKQKTANVAAQILAMKNTITDLELQILGASCDCATMNSGAKPSDVDMAALTSDVAALEGTCMTKEQTVSALDAQLQAVTGTVEGFVTKSDVSSTKTEIEGAVDDVLVLTGRGSTLIETASSQTVVDEARFSANSITADVELLKGQISTCQDTCSTTSSVTTQQVDELRTSISHLAAEIQALSDQHLEISSVVQDRTTNLDSTEEACATLSSSQSVLNTNIGNLINAISTVESSAADIDVNSLDLLTRSRYEELSAEFNALVTQGEDYENILTPLMGTVDQLAEEVSMKVGSNAERIASAGESVDAMADEVDSYHSKYQTVVETGSVVDTAGYGEKLQEASNILSTVQQSKVSLEAAVSRITAVGNSIGSNINTDLNALISSLTSTLNSYSFPATISQLESSVSQLTDTTIPALEAKYATSCRDPFQYNAGLDMCYYINDMKYQWSIAQQMCQVIGGPKARLISLTQEKLEFFQSQLSNSYDDHFIGMYSASYYAGYYYMRWLDGRWEDGTVQWNYGEPNGYWNVMCGGLWRDGYWGKHLLDDQGCDWEVKSICEIPAEYLN